MSEKLFVADIIDRINEFGLHPDLTDEERGKNACAILEDCRGMLQRLSARSEIVPKTDTEIVWQLRNDVPEECAELCERLDDCSDIGRRPACWRGSGQAEGGSMSTVPPSATLGERPELTAAEQEVMYELFDYGTLKHSFMKAEEADDGEKRSEYKEQMRLQDVKLRHMLVALRSPVSETGLKEVVERLYFSAYWTADRDVPDRIWEELRDAAGIAPGQTGARLGPIRTPVSARVPLVPVVRTCDDCGADLFVGMEPK